MRRWNRHLIWIVVATIALTLLGGLAFYRPLQPSIQAVQAATGPDVARPLPLPVKRITFLVMGVDKRPDDIGRADSMVVVSYDPAGNQLSMISLPRDTWAEIPGHGYDKVNHSYAYGGEGLAVQVVQKLLGVPIDHYVTLTFQGFARIVNELGGVEVDAEKRLLYHDPYDTAMGPEGLVIDIQPGPQQMDGLTALKYSRFRMDEEGDFGRMRRQQQVINALIRTAARPSNITSLPQLIPALSQAVATDLSVAEMVRLAAGAKNALATPLRTGTLGGSPKVVNGIFYLIPDLVDDRSKAYETLVGGPPGEAFLKRAREDQAVYTRALAKELDEGAGTAVGAGGAAAPGTAPGGSGEGGSTGGAGAGVGGQTATNARTRTQPITVAVIDASGKNLLAAYVTKLKAEGFRVARVGHTSKPIAQTVALDHAGQAGTGDRLKAVLPKVIVVLAPDKTAGEAVEIILGSDL